MSDADSRSARRCAEEWVRLVLQGNWIPANIAGRFQAVRRSPAGHDLLAAQYRVADCNFRIWDTSVTLTVEISSPSLRNDVTDWFAFLKSVMGRFLNGSGRHEEKTGLDEFARCTIHRRDDVARLLLSYAVPAVRENNPKRYWGEGNPAFWKQGGRLIITLTKLPDGEHPLHGEYGLKQRFPPVESRLASATLDQLIEPLLAVDPRDPDAMAWGRLAERAILKRPDKVCVVRPLLHSLGRARGEYAQLMAINTVDAVLRDCRDRRLLETARESLLALRPTLKDPKVPGQIVNTLRRLEDRLQAIGPERDPGVETGPQAGESPIDEKADTLSAAFLPLVSGRQSALGSFVLVVVLLVAARQLVERWKVRMLRRSQARSRTHPRGLRESGAQVVHSLDGKTGDARGKVRLATLDCIRHDQTVDPHGAARGLGLAPLLRPVAPRTGRS